MTFQLEEATIESVHSHFLDGSLTARALTEAYLARIATPWAKKIGCITALDTERALKTADELDESLKKTGKLSGPLHGIVTLVKDNVLTEGLVTTCGSIALKDLIPTEDATVVKRLREAGAIILGKTTLPDFATSWFSFSSLSGDTLNPYSPKHDPGGSSSGSAAAVAANLCVVAIGTDCGGSVRLPASFCNLIGVRGTPGIVPRTGASSLVDPHDTVGPLTRTVVDAMKVMDVISGFDPRDKISVAATIGRQPKSYLSAILAGTPESPLKGMRIGLVTNGLGHSSAGEKEVTEIVLNAVEVIRKAGATVIEVEIPRMEEYIREGSLYAIASRYYLDRFLGGIPGAQHVTIPEVIKAKQYHPSLDLLESFVDASPDPTHDLEFLTRLVEQENFAEDIAAMMSENQLDGLTYPVLRIPPPANADRLAIPTIAFPTNTLIASQAHLPSMSVPAGFSSLGLPVGIEFVARRYDDTVTHRMAYGFEQAASYRRAPTVFE